VCDGLMHAIPKLPLLVSVTLDCGEFARGVSDVGISSLADSPTITNLALTRSSISETGVNSLRRLTSLVCLNLSGSSKLSDLGIKSLTKLRKLKCMLLLDTARITQRALVECGTPSFSFLHPPLLILHSHNESTDLVITIKSFTLDIHKQRNRHIRATRACTCSWNSARSLTWRLRILERRQQVGKHSLRVSGDARSRHMRSYTSAKRGHATRCTRGLVCCSRCDYRCGALRPPDN
jgi:hypothetical protein